MFLKTTKLNIFHLHYWFKNHNLSTRVVFPKNIKKINVRTNEIYKVKLIYDLFAINKYVNNLCIDI